MNCGDRKLEVHYRFPAVYNRHTRSVQDSDLDCGQSDEWGSFISGVKSSSSPTVNEGLGLSLYSVGNNVA